MDQCQQATPQFPGHYQPHLPGELGFYDLRLVDVQKRQVELAKIYGIAAFCFYFYWFSGKRVLERPLKQWLQHSELDLHFCICWANENWTRRWDGLNNEVLMAQDHSADDDLAFIADVAIFSGPSLRECRRTAGVTCLSSWIAAGHHATTERWRAWCSDNGIGQIFLAYTLAFEMVDPDVIGFDAAIEFPPMHCPLRPPESVITSGPRPFRGELTTGPSSSAKHQVPSAEYPLYRGVSPSWDNAARRGATGSVLVDTHS